MEFSLPCFCSLALNIIAGHGFVEALVIGGTGPTGHYIVNGLLQRGFEVAILHTGRHEVDEIPPEVEHIHTNPFDDAAFADAVYAVTIWLAGHFGAFPLRSPRRSRSVR